MRTLSILTAAAIGLVAGTTFANAQATNFSRESGNAPALYGSSHERDYWAMERRGHYRGHRVRSYEPGYHSYGYAPQGYYRNTEGIPPALYHAGDPAFWR